MGTADPRNRPILIPTTTRATSAPRGRPKTASSALDGSKRAALDYYDFLARSSGAPGFGEQPGTADDASQVQALAADPSTATALLSPVQENSSLSHRHDASVLRSQPGTPRSGTGRRSAGEGSFAAPSPRLSARSPRLSIPSPRLSARSPRPSSPGLPTPRGGSRSGGERSRSSLALVDSDPESNLEGEGGGALSDMDGRSARSSLHGREGREGLTFQPSTPTVRSARPSASQNLVPAADLPGEEQEWRLASELLASDMEMMREGEGDGVPASVRSGPAGSHVRWGNPSEAAGSARPSPAPSPRTARSLRIDVHSRPLSTEPSRFTVAGTMSAARTPSAPTPHDARLLTDLERERRRAAVMAEIVAEQQALLMEAPMYVGALQDGDRAREVFISGLLGKYPLLYPEERKDDVIRLAALQLNGGTNGSGTGGGGSRSDRARENLIVNLQLQVEDLQAQLQEKSARVESAVAARGEVEQELAQSRERGNRLAAIIAQQDALTNTLRTELEAARELLGAREREMTALQEDRRELMARVAQAEEDRDTAVRGSVRLQRQLRSLEAEMDTVLVSLEAPRVLAAVTALGNENVGGRSRRESMGPAAAAEQSLRESFEAMEGPAAALNASLTTEEVKERLEGLVTKLRSSLEDQEAQSPTNSP